MAEQRSHNGMKYVFGPVPSRRLGQSLGIDTIPMKTCNWNCVYCQLGRTRPLVNERRDYYPATDIIREVEVALSLHEPDDIDWITFVGSGEPMLHASMGQIIRRIKQITDIPVAVITNGTLLHMADVREELYPADAVLPSLDAGSPELYKNVNRPHPGVSFEEHTGGLVAFAREYKGKLWVEVMLVAGVNDSERALNDIAVVLRRIKPGGVHISLPTRVTAEPWVAPADERVLLRAMAVLGDVARVVHPAQGRFDFRGCVSVTEVVTAIVKRHPMREDELKRALSSWQPAQVERALSELQESGQIQVVECAGVRFWCSAAAHYAEDPAKRRAARSQKRRGR